MLLANSDVTVCWCLIVNSWVESLHWRRPFRAAAAVQTCPESRRTEVLEDPGHQYFPVESWELWPKWQPHNFVETQQNVREASEETFALHWLHKQFLDCENCLHLSKYIFRHMKCYFLLPGWAVNRPTDIPYMALRDIKIKIKWRWTGKKQELLPLMFSSS